MHACMCARMHSCMRAYMIHIPYATVHYAALHCIALHCIDALVIHTYIHTARQTHSYRYAGTHAYAHTCMHARTQTQITVCDVASFCIVRFECTACSKMQPAWIHDVLMYEACSTFEGSDLTPADVNGACSCAVCATVDSQRQQNSVCDQPFVPTGKRPNVSVRACFIASVAPTVL